MALIACLIFIHNFKFLLGARTGFLLTKSEAVLQSILFLPAFYAHIATGSIVLLIGLFQFRSDRKSIWHRRLGTVYIATILLATAPAGFIMGWFANGGMIPRVSFMVLAVLWWYFTFVAWRKILVRDIVAHQAYMYRSYALTLSAVTLRLYIFGAALFFDLRGEEVYVWVSVLSWVPNLVVAEWVKRGVDMKRLALTK
ncbi:MAG TPA: DUF2306 domain-containing protein [Chryseosolibacter sp.]